MRQIAIFIFAYTAAAVTYILAPSLFTQRDDPHEQNRTKEKIVAQTEYEISESIVRYETVSDRQEALEIETYPNPSANAFNVVFPEDAIDGTYQLTTTTGTILDEGKNSPKVNANRSFYRTFRLLHT